MIDQYIHVLADAAGSGGNNALAWFGALGGGTAFCVAVWAIIRAVLRQVTSVDSNTKAIKDLTAAIEKLEENYIRLDNTAQLHAERLSAQANDIVELRRVVFNAPRTNYQSRRTDNES